MVERKEHRARVASLRPRADGRTEWAVQYLYRYEEQWARVEKYVQSRACRNTVRGSHRKQARRTTMPEDALAASLFALLREEEMALVINLVDADDACCTALVCHAFCDAIFARFPSHSSGMRLCSRLRANVHSLRRLGWALSAGLQCDVRLAAAAAEEGRLRVLKWILEHGELSHFLWAIPEGAARGNQIAVLDFLYGLCAQTEMKMLGNRRKHQFHNQFHDECVCEAAAEAGHLAALQRLRAYHVPWDSRTLIAAARGGHIQLCQWALAAGAPLKRHLRRDPCAVAIEAGQLRFFAWAARQPAFSASTQPQCYEREVSPDKVARALQARGWPVHGCVWQRFREAVAQAEHV